MKCYLTGVDITESNKSLEHILPNALGGQLKSKSVLCSEANLKLSELIDTPFNKIFEGIYRRLPLEKDRTSTWGIIGTHKKYNKEIICKDNKCFPRKPIFDSKKNVLYAKSEKIGKGYIEHLKKDGRIKPKQEVKIWTDMSGEIGFDFKVDNSIFPLGFAKIAAGFATLKGVDRSNLKSILNLTKNEFRNNIMLLPFSPVTPQDTIFEKGTHKSIHYPLHSIVLKGLKEDKILYCFIELFSTFQYVVILDDNYHGKDIHHTYIYDLLNAKEISYETYLDSIIDNPIFRRILTDYKDFNKENLDYIANIGMTQKDLLKLYCYYKFHQLESFVAYITFVEKLDILDGKKTSK
jgi:hypothetical protein